MFHHSTTSYENFLYCAGFPLKKKDKNKNKIKLLAAKSVYFISAILLACLCCELASNYFVICAVY